MDNLINGIESQANPSADTNTNKLPEAGDDVQSTDELKSGDSSGFANDKGGDGGAPQIPSSGVVINLPLSEQNRKLFVELFAEAVTPCQNEIARLAGLFDQMVAEKNRASAAVRLYAEMYERLLSLKTLCNTAIPAEDDVEPSLRRIRKCSINFERIALKNLSSLGMVPIAPERNSPFDPVQYQIMAEVDVAEGETCVPGAVASCEKIGYVQGGIVLRAAEVTVYKQESNQNKKER